LNRYFILNSFAENVKCDKQEKINPRLTHQRNFQVTIGFHTLFFNTNFLINFKAWSISRSLLYFSGNFLSKKNFKIWRFF